jgi:hypothetical protein
MFSCISYLNVEKIDGAQVTVKNQLGGNWFISKDILERDMWSADHFDKEIKCNMTDLSEILESCSDTIFKVQFKTKIDPKSIEEQLTSIKAADVKKADTMKKVSKQILEGKTVEITGHLVESENMLGRSLVIDLSAPCTSNIRSVDHRTIEHIIFKNVKYVLGKKVAGTEDLPLKHNKDDKKWGSSKLIVGNWFSSSSYYEVKEIIDKENCKVTNPYNSQDLTMSRDIMEYEMNSGKLFSKEEKMSKTNIVELMSNAKDCVFTVTFHKQLDDKYVSEKISSAPKDTWGNATKIKSLSKDLSHGAECTMTCFLIKSENKLGRSRVIDLNAPTGMNFRQVDHRTVTSLVLQNVKYTAK